MSSRFGAWSWVLALAAVVGCTRPNAAFEDDGGTAGAGASSTGADATGIDAGPTAEPADSTGGIGGTGETGASSDDGSIVPDICRVDLYAISDAGALNLLDLDGPSWINVATQPDLVSLAIATERSRGDIYVSERDNPSALWRVNPVTFQIDPTVVPVPGQVFPVFGRAGFDAAGMLWLGSESGSTFMSMLPGTASATDHMADGTGGGGDLIVLPTGQLLVVDAEGNAHVLDIVTGMRVTTPIVGLPDTARASGLAYDREGGLWMSVLGPEGNLFELELDGRLTVVDMRTFGIEITDLAPVVTLPGGC